MAPYKNKLNDLPHKKRRNSNKDFQILKTNILFNLNVPHYGKSLTVNIMLLYFRILRLIPTFLPLMILDGNQNHFTNR